MENELQSTIKYIEERSVNVKNNSEKISKALRKIDREFTEYFEEADITFYDSICIGRVNVFFDEVNVYLAINKNENDVWGINLDSKMKGCEYEYNQSIGYSDVEKLNIAIVKRLPEFLKLYSEALEKKDKEYENIASIAEKMEKMFEEGDQ